MIHTTINEANWKQLENNDNDVSQDLNLFHDIEDVYNLSVMV